VEYHILRKLACESRENFLFLYSRERTVDSWFGLVVHQVINWVFTFNLLLGRRWLDVLYQSFQGLLALLLAVYPLSLSLGHCLKTTKSFLELKSWEGLFWLWLWFSDIVNNNHILINLSHRSACPCQCHLGTHKAGSRYGPWATYKLPLFWSLFSQNFIKVEVWLQSLAQNSGSTLLDKITQHGPFSWHWVAILWWNIVLIDIEGPMWTVRLRLRWSIGRGWDPVCVHVLKIVTGLS
jgi:hypothetical protein